MNDEDETEAQKARPMVTEFLSNINSSEDYNSGGKPPVNKSIRTITQIMKEDGVNATEATKIFKAQ